MHEKEIEVDKTLPLGQLLDWILHGLTRLSPRVYLLGGSPDDPSRLIRTADRYHRCFDYYLLVWLVAEILALWIPRQFLSNHPYAAIPILVLCLIHLLELVRGLLFVMIHRSKKDYVSGRKFVISSFAYLEGALIFAIIHYVLPYFLVRDGFTSLRQIIYSGEKPWNGLTALQYSIGCYTTAGAGDMFAIHPNEVAISGIESFFGMFMITVTISSFISRAINVATDGNEIESSSSNKKLSSKEVSAIPEKV